MRSRESNRLVLAQIAKVIEMAGLQTGACRADVGKGSLAENIGGDILDGGIGDLMDETDVLVLARRYPRDDFAPGDFRIDNGFAAAPAIIDHHHEILHTWRPAYPEPDIVNISENQKKVKRNFAKLEVLLTPDSLPEPANRITPRRRRAGVTYFSVARPPAVFAALRVRVALFRRRSIWPRGRVRQISPIHSSLTPLIGLALKLVRLTRVD